MLTVLVCGVFVALGGGASLVGSAYGATVELSYSTFFPATHGNTILAVEWGKAITERTKGAVKINMFPGGTLTPGDQCYDGVVKGISDIGMSVLSYTKGRFPLIEVIDMPLGYKGGLQATRLINAFYGKFKPKELDEVKVMYFHAHGPGILHTTETTITKMDELKGMKIRCTGTTSKVVKALGATPVAMAQTETYEALKKGIAVGVMSPIETMKGWKFAEVTKYTTLNYGSAYSLGFFVVMNKKKWESLPKDVQDAIEKINEEWIDKTGKNWDLIDKEGKEYALTKGHKFLDLSKEQDELWAKTVRPVLDEYVASMQAKSLPGKEALEFCLDWLKKNP